MLLMKLDGSGTVLIDAVLSRLKLASEYEWEAHTYYKGPNRDSLLAKARELFANALEAENSSVEKLLYLSQVNS